RIAWDDDDDDVLDVLGLDSKWFGLRIRMGLVEASYACIIDMPIEVGRAWKLMYTSKRYVWPNFKVSKVQAKKVMHGLRYRCESTCRY
ncbi:hypothetical protein Tco_1049540, partial [Tanacetum coccineum]